MNSSELLDEADGILLTFGLDKEHGSLLGQYQKFVHDSYWEQRKAFYMIGTKRDLLNPSSEYAKYPERMTSYFTLCTSVACTFVSALSGSGIEELCCSIGALHTCP